MKCWQTILGILAVFATSLALAEDLKTLNRKEYKNAKERKI
jgi:hypothetical protein